MRKRNPAPSPFQTDDQVYELLRASQWTFGATNDLTIYQLQLDLATPAIITEEKGNTPAIGLPTLDGFLSYVAFRAALGNALQTNPEQAQSLIWQWNTALRHKNVWIDFPLPIREIPVEGMPSFFDCSIGLPTSAADGILIPTSGLFVNGLTVHTYPIVVDSIPLRRRIAEPYGKPIALKGDLETREGSTKALDNRLYFPLTTSYTFFFRGDKDGIERLLTYAQHDRIGLGKKTVLGHGQIAQFTIVEAKDIKATLGHQVMASLSNSSQISLIKNIPYSYMLRVRNAQNSVIENEQLFGCCQFSVVAAIESLGAYRAPYWHRDHQTQILRYGSIIQPRL